MVAWLDATYYFTVLLIGLTCFGHYHAHHQELATMMLITTLVVSFCKDGGVSVNVFRNTNVKIAFRCRNTIGKLIKPPKDYDILPHNKWGIYQLTCNMQPIIFRPNGCNLKIRSQEHINTLEATTPNRRLPNIFCKINRTRPDEQYNDFAKTSQ